MILVTGGTGLVGAHLLYELCLAGKTPRALYRAPNSLNGVKSLFKSKSDIFESLFAQIEWTQGDILDLETLKFAFADVTELYHCAALISFDPKDYKKHEKAIQRPNKFDKNQQLETRILNIQQEQQLL